MKYDKAPIKTLQTHLTAAEWQFRSAEADRQAEVARRIEARRLGGTSERAAIRAEAPGEPETTWVKRLGHFRREGRDGLVSRRRPAAGVRKLTDEVRGVVRGILSQSPDFRSPQVRARLEAMGIHLSETVVKRAMKQVGLAKARGAPGRRPRVEPLALAGAELLLGVDIEVGATAQLVADLERALSTVAAPEGLVVDDTANRDDHGRFLPTYNADQGRQGAEIGPKFRSTSARPAGKDLPAMRTATSSTASLHRKVVAFVMLPVVTDGPRWGSLTHWQGAHFGGLVGVPYQPATLDKFARELKHAGVAEAARASVARHWLGRAAPSVDTPSGMALVYADVTVKPLWTHAFSRSAKVAKLGGRVMPATSSLFLHTGAGTPVVYRSWSGSASMPREIGALLDEYEEAAGEGTVRRLVVMDREAHASWLFKAMEGRERPWDFIVPLCKNVVGPNADFRDLTPWVAFGTAGDEMCGGSLELRDSKAVGEPVVVRVVGRRRHRTGNVSWYATLVEPEAVPDAQVIELYFARWPRQEHVFRNAAGRLHLDAHHGYGKRQINNVAVLDRLDQMDARLRKATTNLQMWESRCVERVAVLSQEKEAGTQVRARLTVLRETMDAAIAGGRAGTSDFHVAWKTARAFELWLASQHGRVEAAAASVQVANGHVERLRGRIATLAEERPRLERRRQIFTVDVELDQILTAFKLTFLNLCSTLLTRYLGRRPLQLDTLIRGILTLPGEREYTATTETIRIWRQPRDRDIMPLVETACRLLTDRSLVRDKRLLRYEVVDQPQPAPAPAST